jgi:hypothetical protein
MAFIPGNACFHRLDQKVQGIFSVAP